MGLRKFLTGWERINEVPKWIRFPNPDGGDFRFHAKGKNFIYRIDVSRWKGGNQKEKVFRKLRYK